MIYAIAEAADFSIVKIGVTATPNGAINRAAARSRLGNLQTGTWRDLVCIAMAPGTRDDERELHRAFDALRFRGEWFKNEGPVADWVRRWRLMDVINANTKMKPGPRLGAHAVVLKQRRETAKPIDTRGWRVVKLTDADHPFNAAASGLLSLRTG